jgi:ribosome biogenesis GTPase
MSKRRKGPREKDLTSRYMSGGMDEDRVDKTQRFTGRSKNAEQNRILATAMMRAQEQSGADVERLPVGEVIQVFSLFSEVEHAGATYLCVVRKTLSKVSDTSIVVGDRVRFLAVAEPEHALEAPPGTPPADASLPAKPREAVIEQILPRNTVLTRADSFKGTEQHPIVANAGQMLIVASLRDPLVKWGLIDRMLVAARAGGLRAIVCLNKIDLAKPKPGAGEGEIPPDLADAREALAHYRSLGVVTVEASVERQVGLDEIRDLLRDQTTVLAGHSGVGKSSLARAIQPSLDLRVGAISGYTGKGRHTTTSARRYVLDVGGAVVDTPGVKLFGLWGVTRANLPEFFPDVTAGTAPEWRRQSYERILESLPEPAYEDPRTRGAGHDG